MNDRPRRRRYEDAGRGNSGGGMPLFPLVIIVIFAGLLLGGLIAHFSGGNSPRVFSVPSSAPSITPIPTQNPTSTPLALETPTPTPSPQPKRSKGPAAQSPSPSPSAAATTSPTPAVVFVTPSAAPSVVATSAITAAPTAVTSAAPEETPAHAPAASRTPAPTSTPVSNFGAGPTEKDRAASIVRSYLTALSRGDRSTATTYLAQGLPNETYMDSTAKIGQIRSTPADDGNYKVTADVVTQNGEYYETFTVEPSPNGLMITDHFAIKAQ